MLHSTPFRDVQRYLPTIAEIPDIANLGEVSTITTTSGSGSHETAVSSTGPSPPEPASTPDWPLLTRSSQDVRLFSGNVGPANDGFPLAATVLTAPLSLSSRDSPVVQMEDSRSQSTRTCSEHPAPSSSPASRIAWTRATGSACPSAYSPALQTPEDRPPQGIPAQRMCHRVDPPGTSALLSNSPANSGVQVRTARSDLTPPPTTPHGDITNNRQLPPPPHPSDDSPSPAHYTADPPDSFNFFRNSSSVFSQ